MSPLPKCLKNNQLIFLQNMYQLKRQERKSPLCCAGILEQSIGAGNQVETGLSFRPASIHRLAESIPGLFESLKLTSMTTTNLLNTEHYIFTQLHTSTVHPPHECNTIYMVLVTRTV
jgi:hypothetical protein